MRTLAFLGVLLATIPARADARKEFQVAHGEAAAKLIRKDYKGAREAVGRALKLATDDGDRQDAYWTLEAVASNTGDVPAMTESIEFQIPRASARWQRIEKLKRFVSFLRKQNALEPAIGRYREKLAQSPDDLMALGVLTTSIDRAKSKQPESVDLAKRFEAANLKLARQLAQESEELAPKLKENAAMGYAGAAKAWADAEDTERVRLMLKQVTEAPAIKDAFLLALQHEQSGDALVLIGKVEEGVKFYEEAIKAEDSDLQKGRLQDKIKEVRNGHPPRP